MASAVPPLEELLARREWVRRFARSLVADGATADDLAQDAWLYAIESPPRHGRAPLAWFRRVLLNRELNRRRGESRRTAREHAVARPERTDGPDEVVATAEAHRCLVEAVLALDEPYRTTVLLRYFEDLPPREIAERTGASVEAVYSRLRRAIEQLRLRLHPRSGGRDAWVLAVIMGGAQRGRTSWTPTAGGSAALGGLVVKKAIAATVALLSLGLGLWIVLRDRTADDAPLPPVGSSSSTAQAPARRLPRAAPEPETVAAAPREAPPVTSPEPENRPRGVLRAIVLAEDGTSPAGDAQVRVLPFGGRVPDGMTTTKVPWHERKTRTDAAGRFTLEGVPVGAWTIAASHPTLGKGETVGIAGADPVWSLVPLARSDRTMSVKVRTVDEKGLPITGVRIEVVAGRDTPSQVATTDAEGRANLTGLALRQRTVMVTAISKGLATRVILGSSMEEIFVEGCGGPRGRPFILQSGDEFVMALRPMGSIVGRLTAPAGMNPAGASVEAWALKGTGGVHHEVAVGGDATFRLTDLPAGEYSILVRHPGGLRARSPLTSTQKRPGPSLDLPRATVTDGGETTCDLALEMGGTVRGRVLREDGTPVAGARVELHLPLGIEQVKYAGVQLWRLDAEPLADDMRTLSTWVVAVTDPDGRYEVRGLAPANAWRVRVVPEGSELSFDLQESVNVEAEKTTELVHRVAAAGVLEAILPPFSSFTLRRAGENTSRASFITPYVRGAVRIPGLPSGAWQLLEVFNRAQEEILPVGGFEIRPGETTFLDAANAGLSPVALRFVQDGLPVAHVEFETGQGRAFSDEQGLVKFHAFVGRYAVPGQDTVMARFHGPAPGAMTVSGNVSVEPDGAGGWQTTVSVPAGRAVFRALDAEGRPRAGTSVRLSTAGIPRGDRMNVAGCSRSTGVDGEAVFATLPTGTYQWTAQFPEGSSRSATLAVTHGRTQEVPLPWEATGSLRVTVLRPDGKPAAGAGVRVLLLRPGKDPGGPPSTRFANAEVIPDAGQTNDAGVLIVRGVPEGALLVYANPAGRGKHRFGSVLEDSDAIDVVSVPPAEIPVTVRLKTER